MRIVVALSGRALERGGCGSGHAAPGPIGTGLRALGRRHELVVTHGRRRPWTTPGGSGPAALSAGFTATRIAREQAEVGLWLADELDAAATPGAAPVAAVLTRVLIPPARVPGGDPGAGPGAGRGADVAGGEVLELAGIADLVAGGSVVICAGAGGVAVEHDGTGRIRPVDVVLDPDRTAAWLAAALGADRLVLATDVGGVHEHYGTRASRPLRGATDHELAALAMEPDTMGRKVAAASWFVAATGASAVIGPVATLEATLLGDVGTVVSTASDVAARAGAELDATWTMLS